MTLQQLRYIIAVEKHASFNKAAKSLFISQPSISALVKDLEDELGIVIFRRTKKGITLTTDGQELLKYAYQMVDQEDSIKEHFFKEKEEPTTSFSVSSQHYSFVIDLFTQLVQSSLTNQCSLRLKETTTSMVIEDVAKQRSEIGIIFISQYSEKQIKKILKENNLTFTPLISTIPHIFIHQSHPLSTRKYVAKEDLTPFPCIIYDQNNDAPIYFSEEITIPDHNPSKILYVSDLFTSIRLMEKCDAYNIGTGLLPAGKWNMYSQSYTAIPIQDQAPMTVGRISFEQCGIQSVGGKIYCHAA